MYLKQIEIRGFKSFADRTVLELQPGMTAVVGPNGCGKSNIVDAIRWVLGEQSAKALRGASMQDVIFEGTDTRKALPTSEVVLTFTDCEKELGTAFNEVAVSRRVSRDGGSDYFINSKSARLKDVQRLFANTGVGRVSYSFMLQGQIDQILSTNASERRTIFEEAAGITLYKSQRKEALNKLALVDTNLARVTDVIEEVGRQINSLKRQASKALRYQRLEHRLKHLDLALSAKRYSEFDGYIKEFMERSSELNATVASQAKQLQAEEERLKTMKQGRQDLYDGMQELQQRVYNLRSEKENAKNQSELYSVRANDSSVLIENYKQEIHSIEEEQKQIDLRVQRDSESKQKQLNLVGDSDANHQNQETEFLETQAKLNDLESSLQEKRALLLDSENRINRSRSDSTSLELEIKTYQVKHASLTEKIVTLKQELEVFEETQRQILEAERKTSDKVSSLQNEFNEAKQDSENKLKEFRSLQERYQLADRSIAKKTAHLNVLQNLQSKFEGFAEGAKSILSGRLGDLAEESNVTILSKAIQVPQEYTLGMQTLLGMAVDALYVGDNKRALSIIRELDAQKLGRVCLQIDKAPNTSVRNEGLPDFMIPADSVVKVLHEELKPMLGNFLEGCYFCESLERFIEYWTNNPSFQFSLVATQQGEMLDYRGLVYGGSESENQTSGVLERANEIRSLEEEIVLDRKALDSIRQQFEQVEEERTKSIAQCETLQTQLNIMNQELASLKSDARTHEETIEKAVESRKETELKRERLDQEHASLLKKAEQSKSDLSNAEAAYSSLREENRVLEKSIQEMRMVLESQRESLANVRLELAEKRQLLLSVDETIERAELEKKTLAERIARRNQEIHSVHEQIESYRQDAETALQKAKEFEQMHDAGMKELQKKQTELKTIDSSILSTEETLSTQRVSLKKSEQALSDFELKLTERRTKMSFLQERVMTDYQIELDAIDWKSEYWESGNALKIKFSIEGLEDLDVGSKKKEVRSEEPSEADLAEMDALDWNQVEAEVSEFKGRLASMGPVNVDAIGEYADLKERYDFLQEQSNDLWESKNLLVRTIDEINATSLTMFKETFDQVRENFIYTYDKLSGGGVADLKLIDSEDPLESGIDIIARPPGTRLKNVTLLSGGQRTMAAVALLFAIYLVKPSPFCVLDEIDAALDDANIGRFCETLRDFTKKSQFLIITHNKRTISNADTVFGVTMPEKGVSKLISMRFNKSEDNQMVSLS
ncbi:MAG: chromosome segregation protein SMC [Coraliomargaritaceae bacterium]